VVCTVLVLVALLLNSLWVPRFGMSGAAFASLATAGIGLSVTGVVCLRRFGALLPAVSVARIAAAAGATYAAGWALSAHQAQVVIVYAALSAVYALALWRTGEIAGGDVSRIFSAVGIRR
jgi:O-antigen/teichoic acid export membrane protein